MASHARVQMGQSWPGRQVVVPQNEIIGMSLS